MGFTLHQVDRRNPPKPTRALGRRVLCGHCGFRCCGSPGSALSVDLTPAESEELGLPETFSIEGGCRCLTDTGCSLGERRPACCKMAPLKVDKHNNLTVGYWFTLNCPTDRDYEFVGMRGGKYVYRRLPGRSALKTRNSRPEIELDEPIEEFPPAGEANREGVGLLYGNEVADNLCGGEPVPGGFGFAPRKLPQDPGKVSDALTPVERRGNNWIKRDDLFEIAGICGGKVRACWALAQGASELVAASARKSPQMQIVSRLAAHMGIPCRIHTATGRTTPEMRYALENDAELIRHSPGYNSVLVARARADAGARGSTEIPFGMQDPAALPGTRAQAANVPAQARRVVMATGCGMSPLGVLLGLRDRSLATPIIAVRVGADPTRCLRRLGPADWSDQVTVVDVRDRYPYNVGITKELGGIPLDPIYEAKAAELLEPEDLFWIVGVRPTV